MREEDLFQEALEEGDVEGVREYSSKYPNITFEGLTPIHISCCYGNIDIVKLLIEQGCDIECEDSEKGRPIHLACSEGHTDIVRLLIEKGCDIECEDSYKSRPIHSACLEGHIETVRFLIEQHCDIECEDLDKGRPINYACLEGHTEIVRLLIEKGCNIECEDLEESRPIHYACSKGHTDAVRLLIEQGCNIECEDSVKGKPIYYACKYGHTETVRLLIEKDCDIECEDVDNRKPIHIACIFGHTETVRLLIEKGCGIECEDAHKKRPIHLAVAKDHIDIIRLLIEKGCNIECEDLFKMRPIHYACLNGQTDIVFLLLDKGCDFECEDSEKMRPIHLAGLKGHTETIRLLIEKGCSINCEDSVRKRPIHDACANGHFAAVQLLIDKGCDTACEDSKERTPIFLACIFGHNEIVDLLRGENENNRDAIADQMALTCGPSCDHNGFCRESFIHDSCEMKGDLIGEGDYGAVYRFTESATGRRFALKCIKKDDNPNKLKDIETYINICLKSVKHENIVTYFGSITESSSNDVYIFMEYLEGGSLLEYMKNKKGLPPDKVLWFTKQILKGVSFLHRLRIVHRDIKPANILLDGKENVKLSDFGLSHFLQHSDKFLEDPSGPLELLKEEYRKNPVSENLDKIEEMISSYYEFEPVDNYVEDITTETCASGLGTQGYIAPEIRMEEKYKLAVDIWSVGTTMYHMLTGNLPNVYKKFFKIGNRGFVYDLMNAMCKQNPSDRPTAISLLKTIEDNETLLQ